MTLPERIAHFRKKKGWSQRRLADEMGVDHSAPGHWELIGEGRASVPRDMEALFKALDVTVVEFWSAKGPRVRKAAA